MLTVVEVARFMSVSDKTIRKWCGEGRIPHGRLAGTIRFDRDQLQAWVDEGWHSNSKPPAPEDTASED